MLSPPYPFDLWLFIRCRSDLLLSLFLPSIDQIQAWRSESREIMLESLSYIVGVLPPSVAGEQFNSLMSTVLQRIHRLGTLSYQTVMLGNSNDCFFLSCSLLVSLSRTGDLLSFVHFPDFSHNYQHTNSDARGEKR